MAHACRKSNQLARVQTLVYLLTMALVSLTGCSDDKRDDGASGDPSSLGPNASSNSPAYFEESYVLTHAESGSFALVENAKAAPIVVSASDYPGVVRVVSDLRDDIEHGPATALGSDDIQQDQPIDVAPVEDAGGVDGRPDVHRSTEADALLETPLAQQQDGEDAYLVHRSAIAAPQTSRVRYSTKLRSTCKPLAWLFSG